MLGWTEEHLEDLRSIGFSYIRQGKYEIALSFFEGLSAVHSNEPYDLETLGALYLQLGKPEQAIKYFNQALQFEGDHTATLLNLCKAFLMMGKKDEALKLAHILKNEPSPEVSNVAKALILAYG